MKISRQTLSFQSLIFEIGKKMRYFYKFYYLLSFVKQKASRLVVQICKCDFFNIFLISSYFFGALFLMKMAIFFSNQREKEKALTLQKTPIMEYVVPKAKEEISTKPIKTVYKDAFEKAFLSNTNVSFYFKKVWTGSTKMLKLMIISKGRSQWIQTFFINWVKIFVDKNLADRVSKTEKCKVHV